MLPPRVDCCAQLVHTECVAVPLPGNLGAAGRVQPDPILGVGRGGLLSLVSEDDRRGEATKTSNINQRILHFFFSRDHPYGQAHLG